MNRPIKTSLTKPRNKALSLVQTLIGLGIAGLVMVFAFSIGSKLFRPSKLSEAMLALTNKSLVIKESLQEIFQEAPRINGDSAGDFPPIARWSDQSTKVSLGVRGNAELFDTIVVFAHPNSASIPLVTTPIPRPGNRWILTFNTESPNEIAHNLARYFESSIRLSANQILYSVSGLNRIEVLEKANSGNLPGMPTSFSYFFSSEPKIGVFPPEAYIFRELVRYDLFVDNGKLLLTRNTKNSRGTNEQILATGVEKFHVDFMFNDPDAPISNPTYVSHPKASASCDLKDGCPDWTWSDVVSLKVSLRLASEEAFNNSELVDSSQGFKLNDSGRLVFDSEFQIALPGFGIGEMNITAEDLEDCPPSDPGSRCTSECKSVFNDPNPESPRWSGYGDLNSNYCQCGLLAGDIANKDFVSPDHSEILNVIDDWSNNIDPTHLTALNACVAHFGPCDERWKAKDVRSQVVCDCIYQADRFVSGAFGAYSVSYPDNQTALPPIRCEFWQTCRDRLDNWLAPAGNIFTEECGCLFLERDENGAPTNSRIAQRDYARLCNPVTCDENFSNDNYNVRNPNQLAQRFLLTEATFCECGQQIGNFGPAAEFRQPRADGDPEPTQGGIPQDGSRAPVLTMDAFTYELNDATQTQADGQNCAQAQCDSVGVSVGCCITPPPSEGFPNSADFPNHGTYCRNACSFVTRNNVRNDLRRVILGIDQAEPLPWFCGGGFNNNTDESTVGQ